MPWARAQSGRLLPAAFVRAGEAEPEPAPWGPARHPRRALARLVARLLERPGLGPTGLGDAQQLPRASSRLGTFGAQTASWRRTAGSWCPRRCSRGPWPRRSRPQGPPRGALTTAEGPSGRRAVLPPPPPPGTRTDQRPWTSALTRPGGRPLLREGLSLPRLPSAAERSARRSRISPRGLSRPWGPAGGPAGSWAGTSSPGSKVTAHRAPRRRGTSTQPGRWGERQGLDPGGHEAPGPRHPRGHRAPRNPTAVSPSLGCVPERSTARTPTVSSSLEPGGTTVTRVSGPQSSGLWCAPETRPQRRVAESRDRPLGRRRRS